MLIDDLRELTLLDRREETECFVRCPEFRFEPLLPRRFTAPRARPFVGVPGTTGNPTLLPASFRFALRPSSNHILKAVKRLARFLPTLPPFELTPPRLGNAVRVSPGDVASVGEGDSGLECFGGLAMIQGDESCDGSRSYSVAAGPSGLAGGDLGRLLGMLP